MAGMDEEKIKEIRALIAPESPTDAVRVPVADLRALLDAADEARHLRLVLQEVAIRNRQQMDKVRAAFHGLSSALRGSDMDPASAYVPGVVRELIDGQKSIQAIKVLRDMNPGLALGQAKAIVDRLRDAA